jgi:VanZ family protein
MFLSISIESLQSFLPDRYTSMMDVLSNTSGVIAGFFVVAFPWTKIFHIIRSNKYE